MTSEIDPLVSPSVRRNVITVITPTQICASRRSSEKNDRATQVGPFDSDPMTNRSRGIWVNAKRILRPKIFERLDLLMFFRSSNRMDLFTSFSSLTAEWRARFVFRMVNKAVPLSRSPSQLQFL